MTAINELQIKILIFILILAVLGLPYYFVVMPARDASAILRDNIATLETEKRRLEDFEAHEGEYRAGIAENERIVNDILKSYPRALPQEASILFVDATEKLIGIRLDSVSFAAMTDTQITGIVYDDRGRPVSIADVQEAQLEAQAAEAEGEEAPVVNNAVVTSTSIGDILVSTKADLVFNYSVPYNEFKEFLDYILNYSERRVITTINANFNADTQRVMGGFTMSLYAVNGPGRPPVVVTEPDFELGARNIFLQARGLYYIDDDTWLFPDFFVRFRFHDHDDGSDDHDDDDAIIMGRANDFNSASYLTADYQGTESLTMTFTGKEGVYSVEYSLGDQVYEGDALAFFKSDYLNVDIYGADRHTHTFPQTIIYINNQSDLPVNVTIFDDDPENSLFVIEPSGDVFIRHWIEPEETDIIP
jgi:hypothetical protein